MASRKTHPVVGLAERVATAWLSRMSPDSLRLVSGGGYALYVHRDGYAWSDHDGRREEHDAICPIALSVALTVQNVASEAALVEALLLSAVEDAAQRYAETQPQPDGLEAADVLGEEALMAGCVDVFGVQSLGAVLALKKGA